MTKALKRFLLIRKQAGGCDYTIDCGTDVRALTGDSVEDVVARLRDTVLHEECDDGFRFVDRGYNDHVHHAYVVEVASETVLPLAEWNEEFHRQEAEYVESKEREELARLQAKYGGAS